MGRSPSPGQFIGLGLSFGVTMFVSILIATKVGGWIDGKLGLNGVFTFIGLLMGIFSGFRLLMENIRDLEKKKLWERYDDEDDD